MYLRFCKRKIHFSSVDVMKGPLWWHFCVFCRYSHLFYLSIQLAHIQIYHTVQNNHNNDFDVTMLYSSGFCVFSSLMFLKLSRNHQVHHHLVYMYIYGVQCVCMYKEGNLDKSCHPSINYHQSVCKWHGILFISGKLHTYNILLFFWGNTPKSYIA